MVSEFVGIQELAEDGAALAATATQARAEQGGAGSERSEWGELCSPLQLMQKWLRKRTLILAGTSLVNLGLCLISNLVFALSSNPT